MKDKGAHGDLSKALNKQTVVSERSRGYKYDWDSIRTQYIEGIRALNNEGEQSDSRDFTSLKELAERCNIPYERVRERSASESWVENRNAYQLKMAKQGRAARIMKLSHEKVDFDDKTLDVAKMGLNLIQIRLNEIRQDVALAQARKKVAIEELALGFDVDPKDLKSAIWSKEMDQLARSTSLWQQIGVKSLGSEVIKHEIQLEANMEIDIQMTSISAELSRDDPERLAHLLNIAQRAGLFDGILNAEVVNTEVGE
jgi:hypothetical protein